MPNQYPYESGYRGYKLLTIAIDDYAQAPLRTAKNGAKALRKILREKNQGFGNGGQDNPDLFDRAATADAIRTALQALQCKVEDYENPTQREHGLIIYVAGHATVRLTRDGVPVGYFVPHDYQPGNWNSLIPLEFFTEARHFMASKHVLFIFDCCFAGSVFSRSMLALQNDFRSEAQHQKFETKLKLSREQESGVKTDLYSRFTGLRAYQVLAAGNYDQPALDFYKSKTSLPPSVQVSTADQSPFTQSLLEGLNGAAADDFGMITTDSLAIYLRGRFAGKPEIQNPRHGYLPGHDGGDFVLATHQTAGREMKVAAGEPAPHKAGVIVLISPSSAANRNQIGLDKTQWAGIEHHRCKDEGEITIPLRVTSNPGLLKQLWLIHTSESDVVAYEMERRYQSVKIEVRRVCIGDAYSIEAARQAVAEAVEGSGLSVTDLIVDVTGGTTPMSIGAARTCQEKGVQMQYCRPNHLAYAGGRPDTTNRILVPVLLKTEEVISG